MGTELGFAEAKPLFDNILHLYKAFEGLNLDDLPHAKLVLLAKDTNSAIGIFKAIKDFSTSVQNPKQTRDNLINRLSTEYDAQFDHLHSLVAYLGNTESKIRQYEVKATESTEKLERKERESQTHLATIESVLKSVRSAAAQVGISQHASYFADEARMNKDAARNWLIWTIILGVISCGWGMFLFFKLPSKDISTLQLISQSVAKLIVLSVLYYLLVWCARNCASHYHNYVINRHRQNALSTFETFVKAADNDPDIKNAVLLQATQSIFSSQASGYNYGQSDTEHPTKIIEILRNIAGTPEK